MDINLLLKGFGVGLVVAIPIGPVGLLCTQRILANGRTHGLVSGLGAATADAIYASIAAFGLTLVSDFLVENQMWFRLFAGIFFCLLGIRTFLVKQVKKGPLVERFCHFNNYFSALLISLSNPTSILVSAGVFAELSVIGSATRLNTAGQLVAGVFLGSMFWWITLSIFVGMLHKRLGDNTPGSLARIFGGIITTIGVFVIIITILTIDSN
jgi:threonine/homoserine/homoserine lactone efflux protein